MMSREVLVKICMDPPGVVYHDTMIWITTHQACQILRINKKTLYTWARNKQIKMRRVPPFNFRVFDQDQILALAKTLPKKRGPSIRVFPTEKRQ